MIPIYRVLNEEQIGHVRAVLSELPFQDGKATAGPKARPVKFNEQASDTEGKRKLQQYVRDRLMENPDFRLYARPARWSNLLFSRYGEGQHYGRHFDNWNKNCEGGGRMRSDLSFTLFLGEPNSYEGGELALERPEGQITIKLPAGSVFVYSTGIIHQVLPIRSGMRSVCVGWVQSQIRSEERRQLLYDLEKVLANMQEGEPRLILDKTIGTLLRMWAEP